jgi:branched-chain amino acid transport system permease protein
MDYLRDAIVLGGLYSLFALGLTLSWGVLNILNLAHGSVLVAAALVAYLVTEATPVSIWLLFPLCVAVGAVLGLALEALVFRPIRSRAHNDEDAGLTIMIGSLAAGALLFAITERITAGQVRSIDPRTLEIVTFSVGGTVVSNIQLLIVAVSLAASLALALFVGRSRQGRALRALAFDRETAGLLGISARRLGLATMATAGGLAGAAGLLVALYIGSIEANMTQSLLLKAFAVIVVGGVGSIYGTTFGAYFIAIAEVATVYYLGSGLRDGVAFVLILGLLLLRPQGLFAKSAWQRA